MSRRGGHSDILTTPSTALSRWAVSGTSSAVQFWRVCSREIRNASGFALIDLIFVCGIIGLLSSIAVPSLLRAKQAAGAASAIGSLRAIASAQLTFALTCGSGFYAPDLDARHAAARQQRGVHRRRTGREHVVVRRAPTVSARRCAVPGCAADLQRTRRRARRHKVTGPPRIRRNRTISASSASTHRRSSTKTACPCSTTCRNSATCRPA